MKAVSNVSQKSEEKITIIREKFYNEIGRDERYREKINLNEYNKDYYGNLAGNKFDLAMDNAFNGFIISVLQLYYEFSFDFKNPTHELEAKGFKVHRWTCVPSIQEFKYVLHKSCQLWVISTSISHLNKEFYDVIKEFFDNRKGVYILGDNDPFYTGANELAKKLIAVEMTGYILGGQTVTIQKEKKKSGLVIENIITTGLDFLYEGFTVATINDHPYLDPVMYGSANNLVVASYNKDGKRAIIDGGFTRLFYNWNNAGTGRYIKNAAAWLANIENIPI